MQKGDPDFLAKGEDPKHNHGSHCLNSGLMLLRPNGNIRDMIRVMGKLPPSILRGGDFARCPHGFDQPLLNFIFPTFHTFGSSHRQLGPYMNKQCTNGSPDAVLREVDSYHFWNQTGPWLGSLPSSEPCYSVHELMSRTWWGFFKKLPDSAKDLCMSRMPRFGRAPRLQFSRSESVPPMLRREHNLPWLPLLPNVSSRSLPRPLPGPSKAQRLPVSNKNKTPASFAEAGSFHTRIDSPRRVRVDITSLHEESAREAHTTDQAVAKHTARGNGNGAMKMQSRGESATAQKRFSSSRRRRRSTNVATSAQAKRIQSLEKQLAKKDEQISGLLRSQLYAHRSDRRDDSRSRTTAAAEK